MSEIRRRSVSSLSWPPRGKLSSAQNRSVMGHIPTIKRIIQRTIRAQISQTREGLRSFVLSLRKARVDLLLFAAPRILEPMDEGNYRAYDRLLAN